MKSFAVRPVPLKRKNAAGPQSADWALYDPAKLAVDLGLPVDQVHVALERNGFCKAVHIREEVLRWKERLRREEKELSKELKELGQRRRELGQRLKEVHEMLINTRNLLRLPREHELALKAAGDDASNLTSLHDFVDQDEDAA